LPGQSDELSQPAAELAIGHASERVARREDVPALRRERNVPGEVERILRFPEVGVQMEEETTG
jgi:hypothetical protein